MRQPHRSMFLEWNPTLTAVSHTSWMTPFHLCCSHIWKIETPALLCTDIKALVFSVPSIQVLFACAHKRSSTGRLGLDFRASAFAFLTAGGGFCNVSQLTGPVVFCSAVLRSCSVLVHCLCKVLKGLPAIFALVEGKFVIVPLRCSQRPICCNIISDATVKCSI